MASVLAYDEIKAHLTTVHAPISVLDFDDLEDGLEQGTDKIIVLEEVSSFEDTIAFGDPSAICIREVTTFIIHCMVPSPESSGLARLLAEQVQTGLRWQLLNGVNVTSVDPPDPEFYNDGLWTSYGIAVLVNVDRHIALP